MVVILSFTSPFFPKVMKSWIFGGFILVGIGFLVFDFGVVSFITPRFGSNWSRSADACGVASRNLWELKMERRRVLLQERTQQIRSWMSSKSIKPKIAYDLFEPDYDCNTKTRVGARYFGDGPKFMCDVEVIPPQKKCLVYSVGSNGDFSFETAIFKRFECEIHTFDPTDTTGTWKDKAKSAHAVFHDLGLGEKKEFVKIMRTHAQKKKPKCALDTFRNIVRSLGHDERMIDVLKIDCEGCEWNVFPDIWKDLEKGVYRIGQILVEVHGTDFKRAAEFFEGARKAGYMIFSKERNHWGCNGFNCLEFGLVHLDVANRSASLFGNLIASRPKVLERKVSENSHHMKYLTYTFSYDCLGSKNFTSRNIAGVAGLRHVEMCLTNFLQTPHKGRSLILPSPAIMILQSHARYPLPPAVQWSDLYDISKWGIKEEAIVKFMPDGAVESPLGLNISYFRPSDVKTALKSTSDVAVVNYCNYQSQKKAYRHYMCHTAGRNAALFRPSKKLLDKAEKIIDQKLGGRYALVHIRRGDFLHNKKLAPPNGTYPYTEKMFVANFIEKELSEKVVLLASNEECPEYYTFIMENTPSKRIVLEKDIFDFSDHPIVRYVVLRELAERSSTNVATRHLRMGKRADKSLFKEFSRRKR